jgi:acyl-CoA thioester hydrolase
MIKSETDRPWTGIVKPDWTDYNGHLNVRYFLWIFDEATHIWYADLKLGQPYRESTNHTTFAVQCHITYQREGREGDNLSIRSQMLGYDDKRMHYFKTLYNDDGDYQMATFEQLCVHVDLSTRKVVSWPAEIMQSFEERFTSHSQLELPPQVGAVMDVKSDHSILRT